jgi:hypothetical protein
MVAKTTFAAIVAAALVPLAGAAGCSQASDPPGLTSQQVGGPVYCAIAGEVVAAGQLNAANACLACDPGASFSAWTALPDGSSCGVGAECLAGVCVVPSPGPRPGPGPNACAIGGNLFGVGAENPSDVCQICWPTASTTTWTNAIDGKPCANGSCTAGVCAPPSSKPPPHPPPPPPGVDAGGGGAGPVGCTVVSGTTATTVLDGDLNPNNVCQTCDLAKSSTSWSNFPDGAACSDAPDQACFGGQCTSKFPNCTIGGASVAPDDTNPMNPCERCQPRQSLTHWTAAPDGTSCGFGICVAGACGAE